MKYGYEIEGTYQGRFSIYLSAEEWREVLLQFDTKSIIQIFSGYEQIYISDHKCLLNSYPDDFKNFVELNHDKYVVVETYVYYELLQELSQTVDVMLVIPWTDDIDKLSYKDHIKFTKGQHVFSVQKRDMFETFPEQFAKDVEIKFEDLVYENIVLPSD